MTKNTFARAFCIAKSKVDLSGCYDDRFIGFGLKGWEGFSTTINALAAVIRWQCVRLDGTIDFEAMEECQKAFRHKITILD